jgi:hypothetical protein
MARRFWIAALSCIFAVLKLLAYILSFYILFCAVAPCYLFDNCESSEQYETRKEDPLKDCNNCSPFSTCSSCHGFAFGQEAMTVLPLVFNVQQVYADQSFSFSEGYDVSFFQPPRSAGNLG